MESFDRCIIPERDIDVGCSIQFGVNLTNYSFGWAAFAFSNSQAYAL